MIFLSYKRDPDAPLAHLIEGELRKRGLATWIDTIEPPGGDWERQIRKGIEGCSAFVVILSQEVCGAQDTVVAREVKLALEHQKRIVPVFSPGFSWPAEASAPTWLNAVRTFNGVPASWDYQDAFIDKLARFCTGQEWGDRSEDGLARTRRWWQFWQK